jgi:diaminohydroxyphosphoribosylaminopyrimidine deaminase / 5-amino-6-(5-phosphoribosylamino)uracil reductase
MPDNQYMQRCLELAVKGAGFVAPNPMVGAVLVYENRIIGEGWHQQYGKAHAEVNCIASVKEEDRHLIAQSTLYVSLEPCAHFGKTPPCANLIIQQKIPKVIIGCRDPFTEVNGKGIEKLKATGVEVVLVDAALENECRQLNKRFFTFYTKHRPFVILKWAETKNGKIADASSERLLISNEYANRLVHKWRSEEAAILVGTTTALSDDPELTTRLWKGPSPIRLVIDKELKLPASLKLFNQQVKTIVFNYSKQEERENLLYYKLEKQASLVAQIMDALFQLNIQSVIVEGGAKLLQSFIDEGMWDEARVIKNESLTAGNGLAGPMLPGKLLQEESKIDTDTLHIFYHAKK